MIPLLLTVVVFDLISSNDDDDDDETMSMSMDQKCKVVNIWTILYLTILKYIFLTI